MVTFGLHDLLFVLFRGCANCMLPVFYNRRQNAWRPSTSNKWSLQRPDLRLRACTTSSKGPWPSQSLPCLLAHLCPRGAGRFLLLQPHAQQPKRLKLHHLSPNPKGVTYCWDDTPMCQYRGSPPALLLLGWGVPWRTPILQCHYLLSGAPCPFGHEAVVSPLPHYVL